MLRDVGHCLTVQKLYQSDMKKYTKPEAE